LRLNYRLFAANDPFMKIRISALAAACIIHTTALSHADPCVALGDSLTFAYEAEFGFRITDPLLGTFGDGFGPEVRNWVEILRDPAYRSERFDFGERDEFRLFTLFKTYRLLFRHNYNWALPGLKIGELREFIEGDLTFDDLVSSDPDLELLLEFSDLDTSTAFELTLAERPIQRQFPPQYQRPGSHRQRDHRCLQRPLRGRDRAAHRDRNARRTSREIRRADRHELRIMDGFLRLGGPRAGR